MHTLCYLLKRTRIWLWQQQKLCALVRLFSLWKQYEWWVTCNLIRKYYWIHKIWETWFEVCAAFALFQHKTRPMAALTSQCECNLQFGTGEHLYGCTRPSQLLVNTTRTESQTVNKYREKHFENSFARNSEIYDFEQCKSSVIEADKATCICWWNIWIQVPVHMMVNY